MASGLAAAHAQGLMIHRDIIAKLHSKEPSQRIQSARELADLLAKGAAQLIEHGRIADVASPDGQPGAFGSQAVYLSRSVAMLHFGRAIRSSRIPSGVTLV